jgi:hypothetical protein
VPRAATMAEDDGALVVTVPGLVDVEQVIVRLDGSRPRLPGMDAVGNGFAGRRLEG